MVDQINFVSSTTPKHLLAEIKILKTAEYWNNLRFIYSEYVGVYFNFHVVKKKLISFTSINLSSVKTSGIHGNDFFLIEQFLYLNYQFGP